MNDKIKENKEKINWDVWKDVTPLKKNYRIVTTLKAGIKDNAGDAVTNALRNMSFASVKSVRIGKTYYIKCDPEKVKSIAKALVNVVMEDYSIEEVSSYE